jgi:hypothetical protein
LTTIPDHLANPEFRVAPTPLKDELTAGEQLLEINGSTHRVYIDTTGASPPAVLLPFDHLIDIRVTAAKRLWLALTGRKPGSDPAALSAPRRKRLAFALRALDGRLENATYRAIAAALFGRDRLPQRGWKAHDLRDRTIRLARLGFELMEGGYRDLLLHPYRRRKNHQVLGGGDLTGA